MFFSVFLFIYFLVTYEYLDKPYWELVKINHGIFAHVLYFRKPPSTSVYYINNIYNIHYDCC